MNEFDFDREVITATGDNDVSDNIEIDGESFHVEEFVPTAEDYRALVGGLYKSFYEEDIKSAAYKAIEEKREELRSELEGELKKREQEIKDEMKKDILRKISKRHLRPDENGISVQRTSPARDVSKMTRAERAEAARKAAGGLIINFK